MRQKVIELLGHCLKNFLINRKNDCTRGNKSRYRLGTASYQEEGEQQRWKKKEDYGVWDENENQCAQNLENTRLVIDDTTIYEIDLECERRRGKKYPYS